MSKLIILSNRVSLPQPDHPSAGGLAVALQDALDDVGGIWLGWNGQQIADHLSNEFSHIEDQHVDYITCPLQHSQYSKYYCGFANNTLWPAMHDRVDLIDYKDDEYETYQQVNRLFALQLSKIAQPEDIIWVHDYHFFSVARYCRELGMKNRIGFFLHIPFARLNIWQSLPECASLIKDLCQYDVVGLQTENDQKICMQVCKQVLKAHEIDSEWLRYNHHLTQIKCYPIGVNPELIQDIALQTDKADIQSVFELDTFNQQKTIIGVDRIDYSKGLLERFDAFENFLKYYPEYHRQVTDLQVACPCRIEIPAYENLFERVKDKVKQINQEFSQKDWLPVNCVHDAVDHDLLMKIYRLADICWVSSLRDGMNLVAKEYIAAQNPHDPGVLILSQFAGAAQQMPEALIVDPQDQHAMVDALKTALNMSKVEKLERYQQLISGIKSFDINDWRNAFLEDLSNIDIIQEPIFKLPVQSSSQLSFK